jgi:WD40 repeat protein
LENFDDKLGVIAANNENYVSGSFLGYITLWNSFTAPTNIKMKKCHNSQIDSLYCDNKLIISGARDRTITILDNELTILKKLDLNNIIDRTICLNCSPKSIDIMKYKEIKDINKILIGTLSGEIFELIFENDILKDTEGKCILYNSSHFCENSSESIEITSINYSKKSNLFVTTGKDKTIRFWDPKTKRQIKIIQLNDDDSKPTSSAFYFKEDIFVVGFDSGKIKFFSGIDFSLINEINERNNQINVIKCSRDGLIACGTKDGKGNNVIDIYLSSMKKFGTLMGAQNKIDGIDWSEDSKYLVSFSHDKECRIFSVFDKFMISKYENLDNYEWNTWTLAYGWALKGYYDGNYGKIPIYSSERFKLDNEEIYNIAIGDTSGSIKLFKFPIFSKDQKSVSNFNYHVKKITHLKFGNVENRYILFSSGSDGCLIAWEIKKI